MLVVSDDALNAGLSGLVMVIPLSLESREIEKHSSPYSNCPSRQWTKDAKRDSLRSVTDHKQATFGEFTLGQYLSGEAGGCRRCATHVAQPIRPDQFALLADDRCEEKPVLASSLVFGLEYPTLHDSNSTCGQRR